jgi:hypothetical protein
VEKHEKLTTSDLVAVTGLIVAGQLEVPADSRLVVSSFVWEQFANREQRAFVDACRRRGIAYEVAEQIGGIHLVT